jgi:hypothetical protein
VSSRVRSAVAYLLARISEQDRPDTHTWAASQKELVELAVDIAEGRTLAATDPLTRGLGYAILSIMSKPYVDRDDFHAMIRR